MPPPKREELIGLFDRVRFHPLSIAVLAHQLRTRTAQQLGARLEQLLDHRATSPIPNEGTPPSLIASLELSLDRLDPEQRQALARLGVFQGGAFEDDLLAITGLGDGANPWPALRRQLEAAALIEAESIPGVAPPFLRFHPTLAPMLWATLDADAQARLTLAHRKRYHALAGFLYQSDPQNPYQARAIAQRELPNLLHAVGQALTAGDEGAMEFVTAANRFLNYFGRTREAAALTRRAEQAAGAVGSEGWFLAQSSRGEQLLASGQVAEAAQCFELIRQALGETPSYRLAITLSRIGRCYEAGGHPDLAEGHYRRGIEVTEALEQNESVRRHRGALHTDLGDVLRHQGRFGEAREQYLKGLEVDKELNDLCGQGASEGQLGSLALQEGDLVEAVRRYQEALALFRRLKEPASEAVVHHQLGVAFQQARQWEQAEHHYREAATLKEAQGMIGGSNGAVTTWNQLAIVCARSGRPEAAETWYRKAIAGMQNPPSGDSGANALNNLADLLQHQPGRLDEACRLAEEALAIKETLDPGAAQIWSTYNILAEIADRQARPDEANRYRRQAREAKRRFAGTAHEMKQFAPLIAALVAAVGGQAEAREVVEQVIPHLQQQGGEKAKLAQAMRRILAGERDPEALCGGIGPTAAMIVETILQALKISPSEILE